MGNDCVCLNKTETPEIYTPAKTDFDPITSSFYNKTYENFQVNVDTEIAAKSKAAVASLLSPIKNNDYNNNYLEEMKSFDMKSLEGALTRDTKMQYDPPILRISHLEFAMDLFDEINKLRANPDLFVKLMEKYPNLVVSKDYNKKPGFEIGWNNNLYNLLDDYLDASKDESIGSAFRNKVNQLLGKNKLLNFDLTVRELNIEKNICELIAKFYLSHKEIFQVDHSIGAIGIVSSKDIFRIVLILG